MEGSSPTEIVLRRFKVPPVMEVISCKIIHKFKILCINLSLNFLLRTYYYRKYMSCVDFVTYRSYIIVTMYDILSLLISSQNISWTGKNILWWLCKKRDSIYYYQTFQSYTLSDQCTHPHTCLLKFLKPNFFYYMILSQLQRYPN